VKLYHFTAAHLIEKIKREGLTKGMVPVTTHPPRFLTGLQWLTADGEFDQAWCAQKILVPYDRNAYRITVKVPKKHRKNVLHWLMVCDVNKFPAAVELNRYGDPENWRIYRGFIRPGWFREIKRKEGG